MIGSSPTTYPAEPADGIELGEEFSYEVNVYDGIMYITFESEGHETKTFTKSLVSSDFTTEADIPQQVVNLFGPIGQDGVEQPEAYAGELQYFKQGSYNQANNKNPEDNIVWSTGAESHGGDLATQYANGSYAEVWFKEATVGPGLKPVTTSTDENFGGLTRIYPNPAQNLIHIKVPSSLNYEVNLFNVAGELLLQTSNQPTIQVSTLVEGLYMLQIKDLDSNQTRIERITIGR